jgi:hypothetical protein
LVEGLDTLNTLNTLNTLPTTRCPTPGFAWARRALRAHRFRRRERTSTRREGLRRGEAAERVNPDRRV